MTNENEKQRPEPEDHDQDSEATSTAPPGGRPTDANVIREAREEEQNGSSDAADRRSAG